MIPKVLFDQTLAQYMPVAFARMAVDCSTCWDPNDTSPPVPLLKPFQLVGSSVGSPRLSQDSILLFAICWEKEKYETKRVLIVILNFIIVSLGLNKYTKNGLEKPPEIPRRIV